MGNRRSISTQTEGEGTPSVWPFMIVSPQGPWGPLSKKRGNKGRHRDFNLLGFPKKGDRNDTLAKQGGERKNQIDLGWKGAHMRLDEHLRAGNPLEDHMSRREESLLESERFLLFQQM